MRDEKHDDSQTWDRAFEKWLSTNPRTGARRPASTRRAYARAWADFERFAARSPGLIDQATVEAWLADLRRRSPAARVEQGLVRSGRRRQGQTGLSPSTINLWLSAISAFYEFAAEYEIRDQSGVTRFLWTCDNPCIEVRRPKVDPFQGATYLDVSQLRALLAAIRRAGGRKPVLAARDYALILAYIATGAKNSEVREWRWLCEELAAAPIHVFDAVREWLSVSGRLDGLRPGDYVFVGRRLAAGMANADAGGGGEWSEEPLSAQQVNRILRKYARAAGLVADRLHVHCLRHSAYMLYRSTGITIEERSRILDHSSVAVTIGLEAAVPRLRPAAWERAAAVLGV